MKRKDITGQKFGKWTVLNYIGRINNSCIYLCRCECGTERAVRREGLVRGRSKSCGCSCGYSHKPIHHGMSRTPLYNRWVSMQKRTNPQSTCYASKVYRDKGIGVCKEWLEFEHFRDWALSNGYADDLQLDRIDNHGDYCPENCRWVTRRVNTNNRDVSVNITIDGETKPLTEWCEMYGMKRQTVYSRIKRSGWDPLKALTTPLVKCRNTD